MIRPVRLKLTVSLIVLLALLCFSWAFVPANADDDDDDDGGSSSIGYVPKEVVVKLNQASDLPAVAARHKLDPVPLDQFGSRPIYRLRINDNVGPPQRAAQLLNDPEGRVAYAEPNYETRVPEGQGVTWSDGGGSSGYAEPWFKDKIRLTAAHSKTRGANVTVAVLDTGVDASHPELAKPGRLVQGKDFVDMDDDPSEVGGYGQKPSYGHGTHVAGLIALVAPDAKIMPVRVLDVNGGGNVWVLAEALAFAVDPDNNPATNDGADVINLSLSTKRPTQLLAAIVGDATSCGSDDDGGGDDGDDDDGDDGDDDGGCLASSRRGVVVVAAAGNTGTTTREYPAGEGVAGVLAVAASTRSDGLAAFSTRGSWVRIAAPGVDIMSSIPQGMYGAWSGTSMAAPLAAGEVALIRAAYPNLKATEVADRVVRTATSINASVRRRINAAAALGL